MLHKMFEDGDWFAPKRFGYGAGLPIAWQGWVLCAAYLAALAGIGFLDATGHRPGGVGIRIAALVLFVAVTGLFFVITARHTRGGWKWRWGGD